MAPVALEHVDKAFPNGVQALRDLSLDAGAGRFTVLVGPSGSGKTTTLRLIAGLDEPTGGLVRIAGRVVNRMPPRERDVAMVFQRHSLYPHLTVRDNLAFGYRLRHPGGWLRPSRRADQRVLRERVAEAARALDLESLLDRYPHQLSGGQQQRAALGRALVRRPAVLLLDEPLSHLDLPLRAEMRRQLHLLHRHLQATIIYVTHDQHEALALGERVVVLDRGVVQQAGTPAEVYRQPRNRFVAGFIGWPPMSFVEGRLAADGGVLRFATDGWSVPLPPERSAALQVAAGQPVTLGIRPEHVGLGSGGLRMEVAEVELSGAELVLTLRQAETRLTARLDARRPVAAGETVEVALDMAQSHWFDPASGLALAGDPAG